MLTAIILAHTSVAHAAPNSVFAQDWSVLEARLDSCVVDWDDLIHAHVKSGVSGADATQLEYVSLHTRGTTTPSPWPET